MACYLKTSFSKDRLTSPRGSRLPFFKCLSITSLVIFSVVLTPDSAWSSPTRPTANQRVMNVINQIRKSLIASKYQHFTRVRKRKGEYFFDCSGMAAWVLRRSTPQALQSLGKPNGGRPLAVHFYRKIARIPAGERRRAWQRIGDLARAEPGDVLAWIRPKWFPSKSTGHVAFVVERPIPSTGQIPGLLFRIADASKFRHENDSRQPGETGFGIGTLLVPTKQNGDPIGYGWVGSRTIEEWIVPTDLVIGRPLR
jgi:hypothetical protein